jgi:hypothetical protein
MTTETKTKPKSKTTAPVAKSKPKSTTEIPQLNKTEETPPLGTAGNPLPIRATDKTRAALTDQLVDHTMGRLAVVMRRPQAERPTDAEMSFGAGAFAGLEPQNTAEVLLVTQMVGTHEMAMEMLTRSKRADTVEYMQETGALAAKLLSVFERQFATLTRARKPPQVVTVEHVHKHLHVNGQQTPGPMGEVIRIEGQPHGANDPRALALAPSPALLGEDQAPEPVSVTSNAERPLPNPRRPLARRAKR